MSYETEGTVKLIEDTQTFSSGFAKREFVITTPEKYPQDLKFEAIKDKMEQLGGINVGDKVKVFFNVRGNEFKGRYFVNLQAWKIELFEAAPVVDSSDIEENVPQSSSNVEDEESPF